MKTYDFISYNVDFALGGKAVDQDLSILLKNEADAYILLETKAVDVDKLVDRDYLRFLQNKSTEALAGTTLAWSKKSFCGRGKGTKVGTSPRGYKMLTRYIKWVDLMAVDESGEEHVVRLVGIHLPPNRYRVLVPGMLASLAALIAATRKSTPVVIGGDWNLSVMTDKRLKFLADRFNGTRHGAGIDGFLVIPRGKLRVASFKELRKVNDNRTAHHPVRLTVRFTQ